MRGRRVATTAFVSVLVVWTAAFGPQQGTVISLGPITISRGGSPQTQKPHVFDLVTLKQWLQAVDAHEAGDFDVPAQAIAALSDDKIAGIVADLQALFQIYRKQLAEERGPQKFGFGVKIGRSSYNSVSLKAEDKTQLTLKTLDDLLGVKSEKEFLARFNEILRRGALLHTDIAFLGTPTPLQDVRDRGHDDGLPVVLHGQDGAFSNLRGPLAHLAACRELLDRIDPDPRADTAVAAWYYATLAVLEGQLAMGDAFPIVTHASELFPQDPRILFYVGVMHEAQANEEFQGTAVNARAMDYAVMVGTEKEELQIALTVFRTAVQLDPRSSEIRLHLGRVTGLLGDHETALRELAVARVGLDERALQYDASLFESAQHEALGSWDAARSDLTRGLELYPDAQSALIGLSRLQLRMGDVVGAMAPLDKLFSKTHDDPARDDPWWTYFVSHARDAEDLLSEARLELARGIR